MIIPKFIYEEIVKYKTDEAYIKGYENAIKNIKLNWFMKYGCDENNSVPATEVIKFLEWVIKDFKGE